MSQIYSKTAKGQEEIKTRAGGLSQRARQILIFVDGKRSGDDLHGMLKGDDMEQQLHALVEQGYIAITGGSKPQPKQAPAVPAAAPAAVSTPAPAQIESMAVQKEKWKKEEEEREELDVARHFLSKM